MLVLGFTTMSVKELHRIAVVGGGMMGRSIATKVSQAGLTVILGEISADRGAQVMRILEHGLDSQIERWALTKAEKKAVLSRIELTTDLERTKDCNLIVETIQEDFDAKRALLRQLDDLAGFQVPIIVNTSTLSITELAH